MTIEVQKHNHSKRIILKKISKLIFNLISFSRRTLGTKLYIIGNEFDLARRFPKSYEKNLKPILEKNDNKLFELVNNLYFVLNPNIQKDYLSEFEKHIGKITDVEQSEFMNFLKDQLDSINFQSSDFFINK